jgi:hypothetical protein
MCGSASRSKESIGSGWHETARTVGFAVQRELIKMAKTLDLTAIVKKTGRNQKTF